GTHRRPRRRGLAERRRGTADRDPAGLGLPHRDRRTGGGSPVRLDQEAFARGMWPEGLVAALATLAVAWPLTELLRDSSWLWPAVLMVAVVALSGAVLRTLDVPPSFVALIQLLLGLAGLMLTYLRETLWRGVLPTGETLDQVG